jgi:AraC family transcriptional regulator of adaptative response/methylated-DNA-[protein]-cysteine methyltransferase
MNDETERIGAICRHIETHSDEPFSLAGLAQIAGMSVGHFARRFKSIVGVTPKQYASEYRLKHFKSGLREGGNIDRSIYEAGYGSASRAYEKATRSLGMTPAQYRNAGGGVAISYASLDTPAGLMLIGATDRGLCFVHFGDDEPALVQRLRGEYPNADIAPMGEPAHPHFAAWIDHIRAAIAGETDTQGLPLDIRATAFQMRVWTFLQTIPYGHVTSYREVAQALGMPTATRAVASAIARNSIAFIIPCHRVIRASGDLAGYRWGLGRKRSLLDHERGRTVETND